MMRQQLVTIVMSLIEQQFRVDPGSLKEKMTASDVAGWDSFAHGQLLLAIEDKLGRPLPVDRLFSVRTIGGLIDVIGEV